MPMGGKFDEPDETAERALKCAGVCDKVQSLTKGMDTIMTKEFDNEGAVLSGGVHMGERSEEAVLREVFEETGENFVIERPLCLIENFFKGTETPEGLDCHAVEFYYLMRPAEKKEYSVKSVTAGGEVEKMCWLPIERIDEYDVRPAVVRDIIRDLPPHFTAFVNDER